MGATPADPPSGVDRRDLDRGPFVWGLDAVAMHDAWWRGRGVQCVHRGRPFEVIPGAELYLLQEEDQIVTFRLADVIDTIVWSNVKAFRVRIIEQSDESYKEEIITNAAGDVLGIRRRYARDEWVGHRVIFTSDEALARAWAEAENGRVAKRAVREIAGLRVARLRVYGHCFDFKLPEGRRGFLLWLVASWNDPDRVLEGIEAIKPGVFASKGTVLPENAICIEPAWLGVDTGLDGQTLIVGPDFAPDGVDGERIDAGIHPLLISEIQLPRGQRGARLLPRQSVYDLAKRTFDVVFAAAVLIVFGPVTLAVAIAVVIDDGFPVFFGHTRQKKDGVNFKCWKFRTMRRNAEAMVAELQTMNKADGPQVFIDNDPRVTRLGRILRKLQLDEVPQFWNVLVGDMSVVGPRPSPDKENQFNPAWREMRLSVRPGITGLWQVERTRTPGQDFQEWIKYDIEYVRSASFWLDLKIIAKTVRNILKRG
jgi:lipopolysaccharide/colanic/teichoic acid biosynthesis glycosyltransferase